MKNKLKCVAQPVSVSDCNPIYVDGRIKYWTVTVDYAGDLSVNTLGRTRARDLVDNNPGLLDDNMNHEMLRAVLKPDVIIPNARRLSGEFRYNPQNNTSSLVYWWRAGFLGLGGNRAWSFRTKMVDAMQQKVK
ncbi:MAG: hypothetical protein J5608_00050 [Alphaproteobacteria bacterium]|nr:hypothetical protein [Alphaproteobacteria bacterium]